MIIPTRRSTQFHLIFGRSRTVSVPRRLSRFRETAQPHSRDDFLSGDGARRKQVKQDGGGKVVAMIGENKLKRQSPPLGRIDGRGTMFRGGHVHTERDTMTLPMMPNGGDRDLSQADSYQISEAGHVEA